MRINPAISTLITMGGTLIFFYIAGFSRVAPADYMAFNVAYGAVSRAIMALGGIAMAVANIQPLLEMVQPILDSIPEYSADKRILTTLSGGVEVNHVTFRYDKDGPAIRRYQLQNPLRKILSTEVKATRQGLVPLRFVTQALNAEVDYDDTIGRVTITIAGGMQIRAASL